MVPVVMYSTRWCPYCVRARQLLAGKGAEVEEIAVDRDPGRREEMYTLSGRRTVPQIWIGPRHIGGFTELRALDQDGRLDAMLSGQGKFGSSSQTHS